MLLVAQWFELTGAGVLAEIAAVFLTAYATSRNHGFLILAAGVALHWWCRVPAMRLADAHLSKASRT